ncbi:putative natural product biosynthesis protein [Pseudomonas poae]|uniref:Putative natural product biosynthesis protein n=1 Tax=Pseudomonas poae TaxID=200451 RepID=A0A2S9E2L0_9PSED|nr:putative natural product biosynthesis protein [Pseudomonas poae]PRA20827.1 putative natural product biosynthesis protein [Pseudomonas poae]PRC09082.1 putative natural product biosynthesis protein [Pseudomonas poae]
MNPVLPAGASRLVSKASRRLRAEPLRADYPSNSRCFVHLDARLLPYWHTLFDICPALLKLDPPEGLNLFRSFMTWAYRNQPPLDWTYHLNVCRWLLGSVYRTQIDDEPIEAFMAAAAARWTHTDVGQAQGVVLAWRGERVFDWKGVPRVDSERQVFPNPVWDFAWCPLSAKGQFSHWLPVP